jgi:hypothetical protein
LLFFLLLRFLVGAVWLGVVHPARWEAFLIGGQSGGVTAGGGVVVGIGVAIDLLRMADVGDRVVGDEPAGDRFVFAGAEVGEAGVVTSAADESLGVGPGGVGAAGVAERVGLAAGDGLSDRVDGDLSRVVVVGGEPRETGRGFGWRRRSSGCRRRRSR